MCLKTNPLLILPLLFGLLAGCGGGSDSTDNGGTGLTAEAGPAQTVNAGANVTLNGSATGGSGNYTYAWSQTAGTPNNIALTGANTARPTFTAPNAAATLIFRVTVTAGEQSHSDTVTITVNAPTGAPLAVEAGDPQTVNVGANVTLDGSASGGLGNHTFAWALTTSVPTSATVTLTGDNTAQPTFTAPARAATLTFTLTVTAGDATATDTVVITVTDQNKPTADAGTDRTIGPGGTSLQGSGTDAEGAVTYRWAFTSNPPGVSVTLTGDDTATPSFSAPTRAAVLTFTLTVTDEAGNETTDTVTITVDPNRPTANAGNDQTVAPNIQVMLDGSGASNAGNSVTYLWSQESGNPATLTLSSNTDKAPTFTSPAASGTYTFTLEVTDSNTGTKTSDSVIIIVDATAPTAEAGNAQTVNLGTNVTLDGTASTDSEDATALSYAWALTASDPAGTNIDLTNATSAEATFTAPDSLVELTFTLTVTDGGNNTDTDTIVITVADQNNPTADAGADQDVSGGQTVTLDGSGSSDGEGTIATWQWSHESGPAASLNGGNTASPSFTAPDTAGAIVLELTVTDEAGNEASDTVTITVDALPVAEAGDDQTVAPGATVTLDGSGSSDNEGAVTYSWALTASSPTASVTLSSNTAESPTFTAPDATGTLTFTLTVTDSAGGVHSDTVDIQIDATAPRANAGSAQTVAVGATVTLDGSASSDTGGSGIASYRWTQKSGTPNNIALTGGDTATPTFTAPRYHRQPGLYPCGHRRGG